LGNGHRFRAAHAPRRPHDGGRLCTCLINSPLPGKGASLEKVSVSRYPIFGRPAIIAVIVSSVVVRIQVARRAISIVRIAAKTQAITCTLSFNLLLLFQGPGPNARRDNRQQDFFQRTLSGLAGPLFRLRRCCTLRRDTNLGRPARKAVIGSSVVGRMQVARRASSIGRIAAKTQANTNTLTNGGITPIIVIIAIMTHPGI